MSSFLGRFIGGDLSVYMQKIIYDIDNNNIVDESEELNDGDGTIITPQEIVTQTDGELHVYADGNTGSDDNDGLTVLTPKKTMQAAADLVPYYINHDVAIHLSGTFTDELLNLNKDVASNKYLVVTGDFSYTTEFGPFTATSSSISTLTVGGSAWTSDQYKGYGLRITSGAQTGEIRIIYGNTADTITVGYNFTVDPGNIDFEIVTPETIVDCLVQYRGIRNYCTGGGNIFIQNITTKNRARIFNFTSVNNVYLVGILSSSVTSAGYYNYNANNLYYSHQPYIVGSGFDTSGEYILGCGHLGNITSYIYNADINKIYFYNCVFNNIKMQKCGIYWITNSKFKKINMQGCFNESYSETTYANFLNFYSDAQDTIITDSDEFGIKLNGCSNITFDDITISDNTEHGIEVLSSSIRFLGATAGTGNGGAGIYAHSGSEILITDGSAPTLTGTVGDIAISDSTIEDATWSDVDAGSEVSIAQEMTIVKEY